jgi:hypothetical protein
MWRLVEVVGVRNDGTVTTSGFGSHPTGYIVYDRSGRMAVQIARDPRPRFRDAEHPTGDEARAALDSYVAYAGTYRYDSAQRVVTHHLELSVDPTDVGQDWAREVSLEGDRVVLVTEPLPLATGERVRHRLTWVRVGP